MHALLLFLVDALAIASWQTKGERVFRENSLFRQSSRKGSLWGGHTLSAVSPLEVFIYSVFSKILRYSCILTRRYRYRFRFRFRCRFRLELAIS
jgi:hypothetical protein